MKRAGIASLVALSGLLGLGALAACRQIVGIGDRSVATDAGAGACGLAFPAGDCNTCMQTKCCSAASACAGEPACKLNEQCVAACGTDEDCVERCQVSNPVGGNVPSVPAMDTCLAASCSSECGLTCSTHVGLAAAPDASAPCRDCIQANACTPAATCSTDLACETYYRCEVACPTLDCTAACALDDAGTDEFQAYGALLLGDCTVACGLGQNWVCAGKVSWPQPKATTLKVSASISDLLTNDPTAGADVKLCAQNDPTCAQPLDDEMTSDAGAVTLSYTLSNTIQGGLRGYLQITSSTITPGLFFWGFPLSEPNAQFGIKISTDATGLIPAYLKELGVTLMAGHGVAFIGALDCSHNPAVGVHVNVLTGGDSSTQVLYGVAGGATFSTSATSTDSSGVALLANVLAGPVSVNVVTASGLVVSQQSFFVVEGAEEEVAALPTPM